VYKECELHGLGAREIADRLDFFGLGPERDESIARLNAILTRFVDTAIIEFYDFLGSVPALKPLLEDGERTNRLRDTQRHYLLTLGIARQTLPYFETRLRVGRAHERVGLAPMHYLGAYAKLEEILIRHIAQEAPEELRGVAATLQRLFWLDADLAMMAYHGRRHEALVESVSADALTGLMTRGFAVAALANENERAARFTRPFSLLFVDLDHFKSLNDCGGHAAGDVLLATAARIIRDSVRPHDIVGRYGGDEFLVGVVEGELGVAAVIAERIRSRIELEFRDQRVDPAPTASIGVAQARHGEPIDALIQRADAAMYRAKASGRNKAVTDH